ncbi:vascular endothelial growth factor A, long form isoform X3 [Larus michahellis]
MGWEGRREGNRRGGWDFAGASLPAAAPSSCRAPASGRWGGRCAGSGRCAEPPLECAERGYRCRAGGEERTPRRRGTARRGEQPSAGTGTCCWLRRLAFILSFNLFFPHLYFDPLGFFILFFFLPFLQSLPPHRFPPSLASLDFFFFTYITILIFFFPKRRTERGRERDRDREGRRKTLCSSPPPPPPRFAERGRAKRRRDQPLPPPPQPGEATPARGAAGGSRREEGAQEKRCIETFRPNFGVSAGNRASERGAGCLPAPARGERPRTGAAVELGLPGGGGRAAAAGRPRSQRSARRSAHRKQQRGPAESRAYGGVKPETPKRNPTSPGAPRSARPAAPQEAAAGTEEARARARRGGGGGAAAARRSAAGPAPRCAPATMNFLLTWIHWGLAALLYLQSAELSKAAPALGDGERKPNEVIKFLEVYERSFCRTIETLVDIFQEYPDEVEYIFKPSCVPLMRCAGCCGDEGLECVPVDVYNVTMEIMRIKPHQSQHIAHMSFLQHSKCDCRPKKDVKNKQEKWAQKPRSDGPSFIPQTWSLHDPRPWQSFLMLYPESGKSRRVCPTRMDSRKSKRGKGKGQKRKRKKGRYKPPSLCEKPRR